MSDQIRRLETGYSPKLIDPTGIELPIVLKNQRGENLASIHLMGDRSDRYQAFVNNHQIDNYGFGYESITECLEAMMAYMYQQMQDYRKQAEEYAELRKVLKKSLDLR